MKVEPDPYQETPVLGAVNHYLVTLPTIAFLRTAMVPPVVPAPVQINATIVRHYDGDSFFVRIPIPIVDKLELTEQEIRLLGCNAAELHTPAGDAAAAAMASRVGMTVGSPIVLTTLGLDKFAGRLDAVVTYLTADGTSHDLVSDLITGQWAAPWNGKGTKPLPPWPRTVTP